MRIKANCQGRACSPGVGFFFLLILSVSGRCYITKQDALQQSDLLFGTYSKQRGGPLLSTRGCCVGRFLQKLREYKAKCSFGWLSDKMELNTNRKYIQEREIISESTTPLSSPTSV